jgi:hypothetical protein
VKQQQKGFIYLANNDNNLVSLGGFQNESHCWEYVSENAKKLVYRQLNKENCKNLKYLNLDYKYHVDNIQHALMRDLQIDKPFHCDEFKWFLDDKNKNGKIVEKS